MQNTATTTAHVEQLLTPADVQRALGVGRTKAYTIAGQLGIKLGRRTLRVRRERLLQYVAQLEANQATNPPAAGDAGADGNPEPGA
jgi:hypothetical protein